MRNTVLSVFVFILLTACGQPDREEDEHVWKDQVDTMDKARNVENQLMEAEKKRREAEEASMQ